MRFEIKKPLEGFVCAASVTVLAAGAIAASEAYEVETTEPVPRTAELAGYMPEPVAIAGLGFVVNLPRPK